MHSTRHGRSLTLQRFVALAGPTVGCGAEAGASHAARARDARRAIPRRTGAVSLQLLELRDGGGGGG